MYHSSFEVVYPLAVMIGRFMRILRVISRLSVLRLALCAVSGFSVLYVVSGFGRTVFAQQPAYGNVAFETIQIRPNVFVIFGGGANVTAHVGEDGVILVDSGSTAMAGRVLEAVKAITPSPIWMIINTSAAAAHVGGNAAISAAGREINPDSFSDEPRATILSHENVLLRMTKGSGNGEEFPTDAWPSETFTSRYRSMYVNDDAVQVIRQIGAVTDGD